MKKFFLMMLLLINSLMMFAVPQNENTARLVAENFIRSRSKQFQIMESYQINSEEKNIAYIYNLKPDGFVAISADNDIFPVIAYSFHNCLWEEDKEENLVYQMIAADIEKRLKFYQNNKDETEKNHQTWINYLNENFNHRDFQQWPPAGSTITDGWVETQWNQSGIFNMFCPLDNSGQRSVVGCVATAMAMIVDFHKYIGNLSFNDYDDYNSGGGGYIDNEHDSRDYPSFPELNEYLNTLRIHYQNEEPLTPQDKAALSFACGISVEMYYSSSGSGAYTSDVAYALTNKFGFDSANWIDNNGTSFYTQLSNEMIYMRPAEMSIYTSGWNNGHAIICDGYNTDNYYHLNYGWGTSNSTCWYLLPYGMPSNYSIIGGAVINIEGGVVPITTQGNVSVNNVSPIGTFITLEGEHHYECFVENENGNFEFPAVLPGTYTATAILNERIFYDSHEVTINASNHYIQFNLGNFEALTGIVSAPTSPQNCVISLYQNGEIVYSGIADANGYFSIPDVLPGTYSATASLNGNYFQQKEVTVTLENQNVNFNLEEYPGNLAISFANSPTEIFHLIPDYQLVAAVKLTPEELTDLSGDIFAKIRFKAPINSSEGEIYAQIWQENQLLSEKQVNNFSFGEWTEVIFTDYIPIDPTKSYYLGYKINSSTGNIAFHDAGPRISNKGAFLRTSGWIELPTSFDYNFCIEPVAISQNFGVISGNVLLSGGNGNILNTKIQAENFVAHPDENGNYTLFSKPGTFDIIASLTDYSSDFLNDISINNGETVNSQNFYLEYNPTESTEDFVSDNEFKLIGNYPNPFKNSTTISFDVVHKESRQNKNITLFIYNIKGQKIRKFSLTGDQSSIIWDGKDEFGKKLNSGVYFYQLKSNNKNSYQKKMILIH